MKHSADTIRHVFQPLSNRQHTLTSYLTHFAVIERERGGSPVFDEKTAAQRFEPSVINRRSLYAS
jgi:hypothetical protein